ncbi:hypothetical protein Amal_03158 [Acetobacter malorum]|uniref:Uncharacterized protein n=1 Tax=Acetobacter malorum TaxID=178901 RepID=A0A177G7U3_9PROT|nr:hypothetical protein Amal_03158 [Acetobacter malorum]
MVLADGNHASGTCELANDHSPQWHRKRVLLIPHAVCRLLYSVEIGPRPDFSRLFYCRAIQTFVNYQGRHTQNIASNADVTMTAAEKLYLATKNKPHPMQNLRS